MVVRLSTATSRCPRKYQMLSSHSAMISKVLRLTVASSGQHRPWRTYSSSPISTSSSFGTEYSKNFYAKVRLWFIVLCGCTHFRYPEPMRLLASLAGADKFDSNIADMRRNAERVKAKVKLAQKARAFQDKQGMSICEPV